MSQSRRTGLPVTVKMRHNAHYVEEIISRSGAAIGKMIAMEQIVPNADQPRKELGDLASLTDSVREKGVLEPLLVRYLAEADRYMIISGERRFHAARAAGLRVKAERAAQLVREAEAAEHTLSACEARLADLTAAAN